MLRRRQPGIPQQLPQNAILFNSGHTTNNAPDNTAYRGTNRATNTRTNGRASFTANRSAGPAACGREGTCSRRSSRLLTLP